MEMVKLVLILALLLTHGFSRDVDVDNRGEGSGESKWPNSKVIQGVLVRMIRKPGPRRHLGLTGKKDSARAQTARKKRRFQTFVGLMGKRSFEDQGRICSTASLATVGTRQHVHDHPYM
ncbi:protachykinin [Xiphias gladius]|uniref:protachykinin n=1 Tax=Xiphias gladius TaxID=8245 RepID=UPI001A99297A|nr:protachykinin [Xiphias gladius]